MDGGAVALSRVVAESSTLLAIQAAGPESVLTGTDVVVRDTEPEPGGAGGFGLQIFDGAHVELERAVVTRSKTLGVSFFGEGTTFAGTDLLVSDVEAADADGSAGMGLQIFGSLGRLERVRVERARSAGILVGDSGTRLVASDLVVEGTRSRVSDGDAGEGMEISGTSEVEVQRARLSGNRRTGIAVFHEGTRLSLQDVLLVEGTLEAECVADWCEGAGGGCGIASLHGAAVDVTRFRSSGHALCGVQVLGGGLDLHEGEVSQNPIGANVQAEGFDLERLRDGVLFVDNDRALDSLELPAPEPVTEIQPEE